MSTVPLVARTPATHVDQGLHAHLVEPSFDYRRDTTIPAFVSLAAGGVVVFAWFAAMFVIVTYGKF